MAHLHNFFILKLTMKDIPVTIKNVMNYFVES